MNVNDVLLEQLFEFYNPILQYGKSIETLEFDLSNEYRLTLTDAYNIYVEYNKNIDELKMLNKRDMTHAFVKYVDEFSVDENYTNSRIDRLNVGIFKNMYSIKVNNFINIWNDYYRNHIPKNLYNNINAISSKSFCDMNCEIDDFIKKKLIAHTMNYNHDKFIIFYDFCRYVYLNQYVTNANLLPQYYDSSEGKLYFSLPYELCKNKGNREQILDGISGSNFVIDSIPIMIKSMIGVVYNYKRIHTKELRVKNSLDFDTPNYIKKITDYIMTKTKRIKSLEEVKVANINKCIMCEDYCKKTNLGNTMSVPLKNSWQDMGAKELRKLNKNDISFNTLFASYESQLLNPILQTIWS